MKLFRIILFEIFALTIALGCIACQKKPNQPSDGVFTPFEGTHYDLIFKDANSEFIHTPSSKSRVVEIREDINLQIVMSDDGKCMLMHTSEARYIWVDSDNAYAWADGDEWDVLQNTVTYYPAYKLEINGDLIYAEFYEAYSQCTFTGPGAETYIAWKREEITGLAAEYPDNQAEWDEQLTALTQELYQHASENDTKLQLTARLKEDTKEAIPLEFIYRPAGMSWISLHATADEQGRILTIIEGDSRIEYEYADDGSYVVCYYLNHGDGESVLNIKGFTNAAGERIREVQYQLIYSGDSDGSVYLRETYAIDYFYENGKRVRAEWTVWPEYDEDGRPIPEISQLTPSSYGEFRYDEDGIWPLWESTTYSDGTYREITYANPAYPYSKIEIIDGVKTTTVYAEDSWDVVETLAVETPDKVTTVYTFENNRCQNAVITDAQGTVLATAEYLYETNNKVGALLSKVVMMSADGTPTGKELRLEYSEIIELHASYSLYDEAGNLLEKDSFNLPVIRNFMYIPVTAFTD